MYQIPNEQKVQRIIKTNTLNRRPSQKQVIIMKDAFMCAYIPENRRSHFPLPSHFFKILFKCWNLKQFQFRYLQCVCVAMPCFVPQVVIFDSCQVIFFAVYYLSSPPCVCLSLRARVCQRTSANRPLPILFALARKNRFVK